MKNLLFASIFALLCAYPISVRAQEVNSDTSNLQSFLDLKFFSLSKNEENAFDTPAAVYIITQEDIRRSGATSVPDALRMAPGLQVAQIGGNTWAVGVRGFNYQYTNKLLVLVDGRTIYTSQFSGVFWDSQDFVLEDIERIEIIRGPGGTIWGANAVNGIINIITKNAKSTIGNSVSSYIGNEGDRGLTVRSGAKNDAGYYRVYAKTKVDSEAIFLNGNNALDGSENSQVGFRYDNNSKNDLKLMVQGGFREGRLDSFFSKFPTTTAPFSYVNDQAKESKGGNVVVKTGKKISDTYEVNTQFNYDYDYYDITNTLRREAHKFDLDLQNTWNFNERNQLLYGLGYSGTSESLISENERLLIYEKPDLFYSTYSAFLQDRFEVLKDKVYFTAGSKLEHTYFTGFEYEPSAKVEYFPKDNQTVWASVTRAVRTPSRGEDSLILRYAGSPTGYFAITNGPEYKSENMIAYETGYRISYRDNILLEMTAFYNDYDNLRTSEPGKKAPFSDIINPLSLYNNGYGETKGLEVNGKWQVNPQWKLQSSYSLLQMNLDIDAGANDIGGPAGLLANEKSFPQNQYKISSFFNITPEIEFDVMAYIIDNLKAGIGGYTQLDSRIGWRPESNIDFSIIGKNLLDDRHQEFTPALYSAPKEISRTIIIKFTYGF